MLHTISWQEYLTAVIILTAGYYTYVALRFKLIKFNKAAAGGLPPVVSAAVIGSIKPDEGTPTADLIFSVSTPDDVSETTIPKGVADDFLAEAQTLADAAENKLEFLTLLEILVTKYEQDQLTLHELYPQLVTSFTVGTNEWPQTQKLSA
jgi:hypothetical protein